MDGNLLPLAFKAFLTAVRPSLLSMLGNIETTSHETSRVPAGKGPLLFKSSNLLSRSVVSLINDGNFRARTDNFLNDIFIGRKTFYALSGI